MFVVGVQFDIFIIVGFDGVCWVYILLFLFRVFGWFVRIGWVVFGRGDFGQDQ